jgi:DNA-binding LytR/AlgR family response regulator
VASALVEQRVPFVVVSGYPRELLPLAVSHAPLLLKPFDSARLVATVRRLFEDLVRHATFPAD